MQVTFTTPLHASVRVRVILRACVGALRRAQVGALSLLLFGGSLLDDETSIGIGRPWRGSFNAAGEQRARGAYAWPQPTQSLQSRCHWI